MALTPQEQAELDSLQKEAAQSQPQAKVSGLTPQEQQELAQLQSEAVAHTNQAPKQKTSALEAGVTGFGKGASFGYLPQLEAVTEPLIQGITDRFLPKDPEGFNVQEAPSQNYTQRRDQQIKAQQLMAQEHPVANALGEVGGSIASGIATGGGISKLAGTGVRAATFGGRLAQAARTGAVIGAIRNPGDAEGEVSPLQPVERAKNIATDALTGTVLQSGLEGLGKVASGIKNASGNLATYAEEKALKAAGAMKKDFKLFNKLGNGDQVGRAVLEEGILSPGDTIHDVADKALEKQKEIGQGISNIYKQVDDVAKSTPGVKNTQNFHQILDEFENEMASKYKGKADGKKVMAAIKDKIEALKENPETADINQLLDYRKDIDKAAKKAGAWGVNQDPDVATELKTLRNKVQDKMFSMAENVDQATGSNYTEDIKGLNKRYSNMKPIADMSANKSAAESANQSFGFGEKVAAVGGIAAKGGPGGIAAALGAKAARQYGNPIVALAANKASKVLSLDPGLLGSFASTLKEAASVSPEKFTATIEALIQKPEFKKALDSLPDRGFNLSPALGENNSSSVSRSPSTKFTRSNP